MVIENFERYSKLINRLNLTLEDERLSDVIPVLMSMLAMAGRFAEADREDMLEMFAERLDEVYDYVELYPIH